MPHDYLLKVLNKLSSAGVVVSKRGPGGGYTLTSPPDKLTSLEVVLAVDSIFRIDGCSLRGVGRKQLCPLHRLLDDAGRAVEEAFQRTTIADLLPGRQTCKSSRS